MASNNNLLVHLKNCFSAPSLRSYLAEFISTFAPPESCTFESESPAYRTSVDAFAG